MTLPNATLFPQAPLPLYIFEPRYRQMLADALDSDRMFAVAMRKPGSGRELPCPVAGLGLIRASVRHQDGTSHLILQGIMRVELEATVRSRPYRIHRIRPLQAPPCDNVRVDALVAKVRELLEERLELGVPMPFPGLSAGQWDGAGAASPLPAKDILRHLDSIADPAQVADLASYVVLPGPRERQTILETLDVETRLRRLIHFLLAELRNQGKTGEP